MRLVEFAAVCKLLYTVECVKGSGAPGGAIRKPQYCCRERKLNRMQDELH